MLRLFQQVQSRLHQPHRRHITGFDTRTEGHQRDVVFLITRTVFRLVDYPANHLQKNTVPIIHDTINGITDRSKKVFM